MPWYRYIGPWKFRPILFGLVFTIVFTSLATGEAFATGEFYQREWQISILLAIAVGALMAGIIGIGTLWQNRFGVKWSSYIFFPLAAIAIAMILRAYLGEFDLALAADPANLIGAVTRNCVFAFLVLGVAGSLTDRLQREVDRTQSALEVSREQQQLILEGDELARRQIAQILHDKVQAGLIAACLELGDMRTTMSTADAHRIDSVIQRLEGIRARDVRAAARTLSPSLQDVDLQTVLEELATQYDPVIDISIRVAPEIESRVTDQRILLGIYRIVEQAILNAARHGRARNVEVKISLTNDAWISLEVKDDGRGLDAVPIIGGVGFAVFNTWTRSLDGSWDLVDHGNGKTTLKAAIPYQG